MKMEINLKLTFTNTREIKLIHKIMKVAVNSDQPDLSDTDRVVLDNMYEYIDNNLNELLKEEE